ncbi:chemotaxis protein CheW [Iodobacter sp.]|jgi:twitching motility protein PilI|uniref:chemotaxis protein CheW n=1 Tax=Iodobacter sp. TaxID=1915058 RepID=UPI0025E75A70|nr:chemotaxis protein CheW [Iodobacter sp.]
MAKRISLREYQEGVMARLRSVAATAQVDARLGVKIGGENWLLDLSDVAEVMPLPAISPVPLVHAWFKGVANLRGNLVSVSDLAAFIGTGSLSATPAARLLLLHPRHILHSAILVDRMLGLKHLADLTPDHALERSGSWVGDAYRDAAGMTWRSLDIQALVAQPAFLQTGQI